MAVSIFIILYLTQKIHLKSAVVFCGSGDGNNELYRKQAFDMGAMLAGMGIRVVYGGARVGLMGAVADGALANGGAVTGVIPGFLKVKEVAHEGLTEMITVETMHERKLKMYELSDGIITLPGGWGTMEEMFEMLSWALLGLHGKPVGLLNLNGYYDALQVMCDKMVHEGFLKESTSKMLIISTSAEELLQKMEAYQPPAVPAWITKQTT
jgi:uncharacterized protein (TIGR00730 family)